MSPLAMLRRGVLTTTEDRRPDSYTGRTMHDRGDVVAAHPHRQFLQTVAFSDFGQHPKVLVRRLARRWDAHQAGHRESEAIAALLEESVHLGGRNPGLLWLGTGVDLDENSRPAALLLALPRECLSQRRAVERLDHVEQFDGGSRLVRLKWTDQVQL